MIAHVPPKLIFSLDTELGALEPDSVVFDTGIVAFVLNPDNITYSYAGHWHWLNGFNANQEGRVKSRSTMDYWCLMPVVPTSRLLKRWHICRALKSIVPRNWN